MAKTALFNTGNPREDLQCILDLINDLHGDLDKQTYDEKVREDFDAPANREYAVNVTAKQERDLTQAVVLIESALKQPADDQQATISRLTAELEGMRTALEDICVISTINHDRLGNTQRVASIVARARRALTPSTPSESAKDGA